jgi:hypothetical protein
MIRVDDNIQLRGDFILVKEVNLDDKIEGTNLTMKYDDNSHFMVAEIVAVSSELELEYAKYYPAIKNVMDARAVAAKYKPGTRVVLQRIAKVPYKDGLYFASFKDILAFLTAEKPKNDKNFEQLSLFG